MKVITIALFLTVTAGLCAQQRPETEKIAPGTDLSAILNNPEALSGTVENLPKEGDDTWILMEADSHVVTDIPVEKLFAVLQDIPGQVKTFAHTREASVLEKSKAGRLAAFTVGVFGIMTSYKARVRERPNFPKSAVMELSQEVAETDIRNLWATWYFERVVVDGKPYTYIRFYDSSEVRSRIPGQKTDIAMANKGAHLDTINQLIAAAKKLP
jgi:ribosome-associated toxin RatA of RatAB toxin-antitoxin module